MTVLITTKPICLPLYAIQLFFMPEMSILPKFGLLQFRNSARIYNKTVDESLQLFKEETKESKINLFVFHKPDQLEELDSTVNFLNNFRVLIYVDWLDEHIAQDKSEATTKLITQKINDNKKFIFLATEEAIQSKWCDWVLRLAKTLKPIEDIAVLPVRADFSDYNDDGEAYLQKYAYIHESDVTPHVYDIKFPNGDIKSLADWIAS